jgi:heme-degrading monooxygenase HmoA
LAMHDLQIILHPQSDAVDRTSIKRENYFWRMLVMIIILFRSRLTAQAGEDYQAMNDELETLVRQNPGFIDVKAYNSEDGERLTVVWWCDEESLRDWRELMRHREAQNTGRAKWYEYYKIEVANVVRARNFERAK